MQVSISTAGKPGHIAGRLSLCLLFLSLILPISASAKEVSVTTRGYGATYKDAVLDGLQSGVGQVMGISMNAEQVTKMSASIAHASAGDTEASATALTKEHSSNVKIGTKGLVSGYRILGHSMEAGQHRVDMKVVIERYETPGPKNNRRRLAVMPFSLDKGLFNCDDSAIEIKSFRDQLAQAMVADFTQSRRFIMLEREYSSVSDAEKRQWLSPDTATKERAKLGRRLGADYLVYGTLRELTVRDTSSSIQVTGQTIKSGQGACVVEYRIMVPATGQIKWAGTSETIFEADGSLRPQAFERKLIDETARDIVQGCLSNIYPMRVVHKSGSQITVNQGGRTLSCGDELVVYRLGAPLKDPYTHESLGREEIRVAAAKITDVKPKYAVAEIVEGDAASISKDAIVRRSSVNRKQGRSSIPAPSKVNNVQIDQQGGVRLPFD